MPAPEPMKKRRAAPWSALLLFGLAALCMVPAVMCFAGAGGLIHPALAEPMAGVVFLVSAIALAGSGGFPMVMARLADRDVEC